MMTIPAAVEEVIKKMPFLENALIEGLINLSALARRIKPQVEDKVGKDVNDSAIIMALNRLAPRLELTSTARFKKVVQNIGDFIVRSNLVNYSFVNSETLYRCQAEILERMSSAKDACCTFSQGIYETTVVISNEFIPLIEDIFSGEKLIMRTLNISSITVKLPEDNVLCPGVYYYIFKELAWDNINISEVISTANEFTVLVSDDDINRAFNILMNTKRNARLQ